MSDEKDSKETNVKTKSKWTTKLKWGLVGVFLFFGLLRLLDVETDGCVYKEDGVIKENAEWLERINNEPDEAERVAMMLECQETQQRIINSMSSAEQARYMLENLDNVE